MIEFERNETNRFLRVTVGCAALTVLGACASGADSGAMTVPVSPDMLVSDMSPARHAVAVGVVSGGEKTNPLWTSQVSNENFKMALANSLELAVLKGDAGAPYILNARLVSLHQPIMGFDMTVTSTVEYTLLPAGQTTPVLDETIVAPYTANFSDALVAGERLKLANEGAMRANIHEIIFRLIRAGDPGGKLSNTGPVRTSSLP